MEKIESLTRLAELASERKAVFCPDYKASGLPPFTKPFPAAFVISMQGRLIERLFRAGLFVYQSAKAEPKEKE